MKKASIREGHGSKRGIGIGGYCSGGRILAAIILCRTHQQGDGMPAVEAPSAAVPTGFVINASTGVIDLEASIPGTYTRTFTATPADTKSNPATGYACAGDIDLYASIIGAYTIAYTSTAGIGGFPGTFTWLPQGLLIQLIFESHDWDRIMPNFLNSQNLNRS